MFKKFVFGLMGLLLLAYLAVVLWPEKKYKAYQVSADYQAQVDAFYVPPMPADWTWRSYETSDGTTLRWGETGNRGAAKATIFWVPGYTATLNMYGEHFDRLAEQGYHIVGLDLRGQGGSERHRDNQPEKLWIDDFADYSNDVAAFIGAQKLPDERSSILTGISFGGHVVTRTIADHQTKIDGLYLIAPAFRPSSGDYSFEEARQLMASAKWFGKSKNYVQGQGNWVPDGLDYSQGSDCSANPKRLYLRDAIFTRLPEQRVGGVTNQWGYEFFDSSEKMLSPGYFEQVGLPVTIISATNDTFVDTSINSKACRENLSQCVEIVMPETGHCLPQERDEVVDAMLAEFDVLLERITSDSN